MFLLDDVRLSSVKMYAKALSKDTRIKGSLTMPGKNEFETNKKSLTNLLLLNVYSLNPKTRTKRIINRVEVEPLHI